MKRLAQLHRNSRGMLSISLIIYGLLVDVSTAHAAETCTGGNLGVTIGTPGLDNFCSGGSSPVYSLAQGIADWMVGIIGGAAVLIIIISGIQMITSAGSPEAIKSAKKRLIACVTALGVLIAMRAILNLIIFQGNF